MFQRRNTNFYRGTANRIFQAEFEVVLQVSTLANARTPAAAAKDISEDIAEGITETTATKTARPTDRLRRDRIDRRQRAFQQLERTSKASLASLNLASASASSGLRSG